MELLTFIIEKYPQEDSLKHKKEEECEFCSCLQMTVNPTFS